jgi:dihydropteridine reductase
MRSLVIGGNGALGRSLVSKLKRAGLSPLSVDFIANSEASDNLLIDPKLTLQAQYKDIRSKLDKSNFKLMFCAAGSWVGGSVGDDSFLEDLAKMHSVNLETAALTCNLASHYLEDKGSLFLVGAESAIHPTPSMIAYGLSKCATHFLVTSTARDPKFANKSVFGILPRTIDTPTNRKYMPDADHLSWTAVLSYLNTAITEFLYVSMIIVIIYVFSLMKFLENVLMNMLQKISVSLLFNIIFILPIIMHCVTGKRPESGSLLSVITEHGKSRWHVHMKL